MDRGSLLHVGCGGDPLPDWLEEYKETRLDIDESHCPDVVSSMTDMGDVGTFDAVYCSHALEHLFPYEVEIALKEFKRVLRDGGVAIVFVPDLEDVRPTEEVLFVSPSGGITGMDLIYGLRKAFKENPYMLHKTGFTQSTLAKEFENVGFRKIETRRLEPYNLLCLGVK